MSFKTIKWIAAIGVLLTGLALTIIVAYIFRVDLSLPMGLLTGLSVALILSIKDPKR